MKFVILSLLFLLFVTPCPAQEECRLELKDSPALLGLRLEMSPEQAQSVFGKDLKIKVKKDGLRIFFQNFIKKPAPSSLNGVRAIYLRFFNRKLYQIEIFYEEKAEWKTLEGFVNSLNLPASYWQITKGKAEIKCNGFTVVADNVLNPRVELTDEINRAALEKQQQEDKARKQS